MWQLWAVFLVGMATGDEDHSTWTSFRFCKDQANCEYIAEQMAPDPLLIQTWIRKPDGEKIQIYFYQ
jgi:hypothetical protein